MFNGSYICAVFSFTRSTARQYWIKSLVPIEKKSASSARISAITAADGISIITPVWIFSSKGFPSFFNSALASSTIIFADWSSGTVAIIGNIILTFPNSLALKIARSCVLKISVLSRHILIARHPINGFISLGILKEEANLSPPRSSVRITTGLSLQTLATCAYASYCSSSLGRSFRFIKKNSVLYKPIPSAPWFTACFASSGISIFAKRETLCPSTVTAGLSFVVSRRAFLSNAICCLCWYLSICFFDGLIIITPSEPSTISRSPSWIVSVTWFAPVTAGTSNARAIIAVWEVGPPISVIIPVTRSLCMTAVSEGERSRATIITSSLMSARDFLL